LPSNPKAIRSFLAQLHPYDALTTETLDEIVSAIDVVEITEGDRIYEFGQKLAGLYIVAEGQIEVFGERGETVSHLGPGNSFGERGLLIDGTAATSAEASSDGRLYLVPASEFDRLRKSEPAFAKFFSRGRSVGARRTDLATARIDELMTRDVASVTSDTSIRRAAELMRNMDISSLAVVDGEELNGIITVSDFAGVVATGMSFDAPVSAVMAANPISLPPEALGTDVLQTMLERHIGHLPITDNGKLEGIVTQTDLVRFQAMSSAQLLSGIVKAKTAEEIAKVTKRLPELLAQLVGAGNSHEVVTRLITDIADAATRRLLILAEEELGAAPVPYLWLACGSQGRQEQTGVSDQDNCLIIDNGMNPDDDTYFKALAKFVCDGLNKAGYVYCPGDMMATSDRWRKPLKTWKGYFNGWIETPNPEAQMLASVMFDLRPIGGAESLFSDLQASTLEDASKNSIFVSHMIANSLKHTPPLGLLRGFATIRSGEHKNRIDLKHNGVVPVVDLGRVYALRGRLRAANTRARLVAAEENGTISSSGGHDLLDSYDLIAETRLRHQARQIRADDKPDNFVDPSSLSDFERSHLRDAFVVVRTMQSAVGHGRGALI
jgi:CBS domain-containing protein